MTSSVGTLLNERYRLDAEVGTGGMSTVYRAFDTVLERQVAIKLMHREIARDSDQLERFRREARAVAQLNHPHVVGVIDAGEDESMPYIVFEYVEGETLKDRIRRHGRLPVSEAVAYAIEISRALGAAHERGIVHRDVKPQNVLVDEEGSAKVTDFGIARTLDQEGLTADGRVLGTTDYVSPEQALGHAVTGQSDLYSLGVVLFEMLTGDVPFHGDNQVAVAMKHVREELPDVQLRRPEVSSALAAVLEKATAKDLDRRYVDDRELIADLEDVLAIETARSGQATGEATAVLRTLPPSARRRLPARVAHRTRAALVLVAIALAAAAVLLLLADRTERGTRQRPASKPPPGLQAVSLKQRGAGDFDPPPGDGREHPDEVRFVVDDDRSSTWSTETYTGTSEDQVTYASAFAEFPVTGVRADYDGKVVLTGSQIVNGANLSALYSGPMQDTSLGKVYVLTPQFANQTITGGNFYGPNTSIFTPSIGVGNIIAVGSYTYSESTVLNHGMIYK
ncbi:MAG: serine/threonine protein kinase, partial [Solirubrobacterales bacterium]|nr:serine/threonine protein kinase [Solirubrobacterales bacterium]